MATYLIISRGDTPSTVRPVLTSADPDVVESAMRAIREKIGGPDAPAPRPLNAA